MLEQAWLKECKTESAWLHVIHGDTKLPLQANSSPLQALVWPSLQALDAFAGTCIAFAGT
jgi:hypothetical protein